MASKEKKNKKMKLGFPLFSNQEEKTLLMSMFKYFIIIQSFVVTVFCILSITYFSKVNISSFLSVDIVTLFIAVIFLSLILIVVGLGASISNTSFTWYIFHAFMLILLIIEVAVTLYASDMSSFVKTASEIWMRGDEEERVMLQQELNCCGLKNFTVPNEDNRCLSKAESACIDKIRNTLEKIRNVSSVAMFVCLSFGIFIDFLGCAICFHPETISFAKQERELDQLEAQQNDLKLFSNPFSA